MYGYFAYMNVHGMYAWCPRPEEGFGSSEIELSLQGFFPPTPNPIPQHSCFSNLRNTVEIA